VIYQTALSGTSYTPTTELAKGSYRVWVRAVSVSGENAVWSAAVTFTVVNSTQLKSDADQPLLASLISERLILKERSTVVEQDSSASQQDRKEGSPALIGGEPRKYARGYVSATEAQIASKTSSVFTDAVASGGVHHRISADDAKSKRSSQSTSALPSELREIDRLMERYEIDV